MPSQTRPKLYLLPGLGGDSRLFVEQKRYFGDQLLCPDFIPPASHHESLRDYARRWLDRLVPTPPYFIGGLSFGGMLAMEMAQVAPTPEAVFLIASCRSCASIRRRFKVLLGVGGRMPVLALRGSIGAFGVGLRLLNDLKPEHRQIVHDLASHPNLPLLQWAGRAITDWRHDGSCPAPVFQIHGQRDLVIPLKTGDPDAILTTGRHLIQFSHADIVNRYIDRRMVECGAAHQRRAASFTPVAPSSR
ncbi:MAG: alpha/beta fold hydrolase [Tepidisphaeraceae bacterium]